MAPTKRNRAQASAEFSKRAKVVDPTHEKIEAISNTLSDPECRVPGTDSHREMLLLAIPHSLAVPKDERHKFQEEAAEMIGAILRNCVADVEKKIADDQAKVEATKHEEGVSMKAIAECVSQIDAQEAEVTRCKEVVQADIEATEGAQAAFNVATDELEGFDQNLQNTMDQKDHCSSVSMCASSFSRMSP